MMSNTEKVIIVTILEVVAIISIYAFFVMPPIPETNDIIVRGTECTESTLSHRMVKFQLPNGKISHYEVITFEYFKDYYSPYVDIKIIKEEYERYLKTSEPDFTDSRLNISYEVLSAEHSNIGDRIVYKISYLDNSEIKHITLPHREKTSRLGMSDRINEHIVTGYMSTNNTSTLTLKSIYFEQYPISDRGFNIYNWELLLVTV